jgi:5-aminolevulinate synthase
MTVTIWKSPLRQTAPDRPKIIATIYLQPINYPTALKGAERLRITPTPFHDDRRIWNVVGALREVWKQLGLPPTVAKERSAA